jgi:hypothetical protein
MLFRSAALIDRLFFLPDRLQGNHGHAPLVSTPSHGSGSHVAPTGDGRHARAKDVSATSRHTTPTNSMRIPPTNEHLYDQDEDNSLRGNRTTTMTTAMTTMTTTTMTSTATTTTTTTSRKKEKVKKEKEMDVPPAINNNNNNDDDDDDNNESIQPVRFYC